MISWILSPSVFSQPRHIYIATRTTYPLCFVDNRILTEPPSLLPLALAFVLAAAGSGLRASLSVLVRECAHLLTHPLVGWIPTQAAVQDAEASGGGGA